MKKISLSFCLALLLLGAAALWFGGYAQFSIARVYVLENEWGRALPWLERAAALGNANAQNHAGLAYARGWGAAKDDDRAIAYFRAVYRQRGWAEDAANLAMTLDSRENGTQEAFDYMLMAAKGGVARAQHALAQKYLFGAGTAADKVQAVYWYRRAIAQNNMESAYGLGAMYARNEVAGAQGPNRLAAYILYKAALSKADGGVLQRLNSVDLSAKMEELAADMPDEVKQTFGTIDARIQSSDMAAILAWIDEPAVP